MISGKQIACVFAVAAASAALIPAAADAATYVVSSTNASGPGTLRQAVADANATPEADVINFADSLPKVLAVGSNDLGPMEITGNLQIAGPGADRLAIYNARNPNLGGRIFNVASGSQTAISGLTLTGVSLGAPGGAVLNRGNLTLQNAAVKLSLAYAESGSEPITGGAIANYGPELKLKNSTLSDNEALGNDGVAARGGAVYTERGTVLINGSDLQRNGASAQGAGSANALGGAIAITGGNVQITDSTLAGNHAKSTRGQGAGGGIANAAALSIASSTLSGNTADGVSAGAGTSGAAGGGLYNHGSGDDSGTFQIVNSTIASNAAGSGTNVGTGGGVADVVSTDFGGPVSGFGDTTIAGNTAAGTGANLYSRTPQLTFLSTIVADPQGSSSCDVQPQNVNSLGYNLDSAHSCMLRKPTDRPDTDPQLKALAANGGPTKTMALGPSSPAVDQGSAGGVLSKDQRGAKRPVIYPGAKPLPPGGDGSDIGAFELQPPSGSSPRIVASVVPGVADTGTRACFRFTAEDKSGHPLEGARVKVAGKQARTGSDGEAQICKRFNRSGERTAKIAKNGFRTAELPIRVR